MNQSTGAPSRIVVVVDENTPASTLLSAAALAARHDATLEWLACVEPPHDMNILARLAGRESDRLISVLLDRKRDAVRLRLREVFAESAVEPHVVVGKAFMEIIRFVVESRCDFVIKAAEAISGGARFLLSSTDQHLLRKCPCPVWLQKPATAGLPKKVLAAIDIDAWDAPEQDTLSELNQRVIEAACMVAAPGAAEVMVLHAWDAVGEGMVWAFSSDADARAVAEAYAREVFQAHERAMADFIDSMACVAEQFGVTLAPRLVRGLPEQVIDAESLAMGTELVVMGTVARTGIQGVLIGNTAENIINCIACPVLAVKPQSFVCPLEFR